MRGKKHDHEIWGGQKDFIPEFMHMFVSFRVSLMLGEALN
jgi:hypothetical protein